jgi:hypothetical protein
MTRFFTVDHENLMQYETKQAPNVKKTLKLAFAKAFVEEKSEFLTKYKK